jgi:hypothetical protein
MHELEVDSDSCVVFYTIRRILPMVSEFVAISVITALNLIINIRNVTEAIHQIKCENKKLFPS